MCTKKVVPVIAVIALVVVAGFVVGRVYAACEAQTECVVSKVFYEDSGSVHCWEFESAQANYAYNWPLAPGGGTRNCSGLNRVREVDTCNPCDPNSTDSPQAATDAGDALSGWEYTAKCTCD